jgi:hypothetical protein
VAGGYRELQGSGSPGSGNVDGWVGPLRRDWHQVGPVYLEVFTLVAKVRSSPEALDDVDGLLEPGLAFIGIDVVSMIFITGRTPAKAYVQTASADQVQRGGIFS